MRTNGLLYVQTVCGGGTNEFGETIGATAEWSKPIPCHIKTVTDNRVGKYEGGIFHQASYQVMIEPEGDFPHFYDDTKRVRLSRRGIDLGEYAVISVIPIETQNRIQLNV